MNLNNTIDNFIHNGIEHDKVSKRPILENLTNVSLRFDIICIGKNTRNYVVVKTCGQFFITYNKLIMEFLKNLSLESMRNDTFVIREQTKYDKKTAYKHFNIMVEVKS